MKFKLLVLSLILLSLSCAVFKPAIQPVNWRDRYNLNDSENWVTDSLSMVIADTFYGKTWQYPEDPDQRDVKIAKLEEGLKEIKIELKLFEVDCDSFWVCNCVDTLPIAYPCCQPKLWLKCDTLWR